MSLIYKIATSAQWREAEAAGRFTGAAIDIAGRGQASHAAMVEAITRLVGHRRRGSATN